jgi:hypothetical protein
VDLRCPGVVGCGSCGHVTPFFATSYAALGNLALPHHDRVKLNKVK